MCHDQFIFYFLSLFIYFDRESRGGAERERERERESPKQAPCCQCRAQRGAVSQTVRSWPELRSRVRCLIATQEPQFCILKWLCYSCTFIADRWKHPHNNLYTNVCNSFIHNIPRLETTQITFNEQVFQQTVVYPYHGILLSIKGYPLIHTTTWINHKGMMLSEKKPIFFLLYTLWFYTLWFYTLWFYLYGILKTTKL